MIAALLIGGLVAAAVAAAVSDLIRRVGPVDPPRARGSHAEPTPTSGGLAILMGTSVGLGIAVVALGGRVGGPGELFGVAWTLAAAGGLGLLGALDDLVDIGARTKLLVQALAALAFAVFVARVQAVPLPGGFVAPLGPVVGALGTALWMVVATNAVNFMDGANGVAGGALAVALLALGLGALGAGAPVVAAAAFAGAAANAGFLPWNLRGRLFQGDAGALFSGVLVSGLAVVAERGGAGLYVYFVPLALLPLLTDVLLTLLARARRGERLLDAHRDHLYQLWLQRTGRSHAALAWRIALVMASFCAYALYLQHAAAGLRPLFFCGALAVSVFGWLRWRRRLEVTPSAEPRSR